MRYVFVVLCVLGIVLSSMALREHYRTDTSPCSINERWDCGIVNHSPYAVMWGIPVATIGIAGYVLMGIVAATRSYRLLLILALAGLGFSLYLTRIEAEILGVYCIYCVGSLGTISLLTILVLVTVIVKKARGAPAAA